MRFEKINETFFVDLDSINCVMIEEDKVFNEKNKEIITLFNAIGFTKYGQRIPVPLFQMEKYSDVEDWIVNAFIKN
jgi:hypothetical protein